MFLAKVLMDSEYRCGDLDLVFSGSIPYIVSIIVLIIKIAVPVLLIVFGMIDLMKSVIASKEDEIKKSQQTFIKRIIAAIIVFFVIQIVQMVVRFVSNSDSNVLNCFNCFINGKNEENSCELVP